jgi:TP901 family phage tail tape measure protein
MVMVSAAMLTPFAIGTKVFMSFEDQMLTVQAVTRGTITELERLGATIEGLAGKTRYTGGEIGAAAVNLARSGFSPAEIEESIGSMLDLARATGTDLPDSARIAAKTLRAFQLPASDMRRVVDVLAATANNSAQTLDDLGESMKYIAPIAKEAGESLEQASMAAGVMATMGIEGTMAGTGYRRLTTKLASKDTQELLRTLLQVKTLDAEGELRPIGELMTDIGKAAAGLPGGERLALFQELFDLRAMGAGLKLTQTAAPVFDRLRDAVNNAGDTAKKTADVMDSGLGGTLWRVYSAAEAAARSIGKSLAPIIAFAGKHIIKIVNQATEWIKANQAIVVGITAVITAVGAAGVALIGLGIAAQVTAFVIGGIAIIFTTLGTALGALLSPIGLVAVAVIGLGGCLLEVLGAGGKAIDWLKTKFGELQDRTSEIFGAISDALAAGDIPLAAKILWELLRAEWIRGTNWLESKWIDFKEAFISTWTEAVYGLAGIFVDGVAQIQTIWAQFAGFVVDKWMWAEEKIASGLAYIIAKAKGLDPTQVMKNVTEDYASRARARGVDRQKRLDEIESSRSSMTANLDRDRQAAHAKRRKGYDADLAASADRLAAAEKRLQVLREEARPKWASSFGDDSKQLDKAASGAGMALAAAGGSVRGTFSARGAGLLGGSSSEEANRKANERTAKAIELIEARIPPWLGFDWGE